MTKTYLASVAAGALVLALTTAANAAVRRHEATADPRPALDQRYADRAAPSTVSSTASTIASSSRGAR